jgi:hypothetical protein
VVFDNGALHIYADAVELSPAPYMWDSTGTFGLVTEYGRAPIPSMVYQHGADIILGHHTVSSQLSWTGDLDECTYHNTARSEAWIRFSYDTQKPE